MSPVPLHILICDDHELIREGLKRLLLDTGRAKHVGECANASDALAAARRERWDLLILDLNLAGGSGLDLLKQFKAEFPRLPVLILSMYPEDQFALRVFRAGANGYLNKNMSSQELLTAVEKITTSGEYVSTAAAAQLMRAIIPPDGKPLHATLSDREDQVLRLIGGGRTVGEIATALGLSVKTVSTYRAIVLRKLALENNAQLMRYVQQHGLDI